VGHQPEKPIGVPKLLGAFRLKGAFRICEIQVQPS
jgi:hypothetical protein